MKIHYLPTYLLHGAETSWEANWSAASQEAPRISRNPKVHYRTHKRPPPVSILGQPNPVHIPTSHLLEIHPNIIPPSTPRSPQWSPSLRFPQQGSNALIILLIIALYTINDKLSVLSHCCQIRQRALYFLCFLRYFSPLYVVWARLKVLEFTNNIINNSSVYYSC